MTKRKKDISPGKSDYIIYTDGGCARNPGGPGGYAAVILDRNTGEVTTLSGGFRSTTNNRMEVMAAVAALEFLPEGASYFLYSDSKYMLNCFDGIWERKKNQDLFSRLDAAAAGKKGGTRWIRGHAGNEYNELCDAMCRDAMLQPGLPEDKGYRFRNTAEREGTGKEYPALHSMAVRIELPEEISGKVRLCDETAAAAVPGANPECREGIERFYREKRTRFRDYSELRTGGFDYFSRKKKDQLTENIAEADLVLSAIKDYFTEERDICTVLRWYRRGLTLPDSIRKTLVDQEVTANTVISRNRRRR